MERWLPIAGYEGRYEVSDFGRVRSLGRYVRIRGNALRWVAPRILRIGYSGHGYPHIGLWKDNQDWSVDIHTLVTRAFLGDPPPGYQCAHLDGNINNCMLTNLTYTTCKENHSHKKLHGTYTYGETHSRAKLTEAEVLDMKELLSLGVSQAKLAKEFGVTQPMVWRIKTRKAWAHLP